MINSLSPPLLSKLNHNSLRIRTFDAFPCVIAFLPHLSRPYYASLLFFPSFHHYPQQLSFSLLLDENNDLNGFVLFLFCQKMEDSVSSVSPELVSLTYGAFISQIVKDYENEVDVNKQIELLGYECCF